MISDPIFEQEGDIGVLTLVTHFGKTCQIRCEKQPGEIFRVGGTAITESTSYEGLLLSTPRAEDSKSSFRAFRLNDAFDGVGVLSPEEWNDADRHCYVTEYYGLDAEGKPPGWLISKCPMRNVNPLFVNVDVLDGGGNIMKRYRVSAFFGTYIILLGVHDGRLN